ncbi:MAG: acyltransferase [Gammaproteobacteria bacterium]
MNNELKPAMPTKFYLPQLDGLRFFAFFLVFLHHFTTGATYFSPHSVAHFVTIKLSTFGWIGVDLFLCLSSFLLTSLMIMEYRNTGSLSIKQFFIRRALRIWPLYYLMMLFAFLILPAITYFSPALHTEAYFTFVKNHLLPFSVFLGNFSYAYFTNTLTLAIGPLWTVSLEEQFYIFWPILLFILLPRNKRWFFFALGFLVVLSFAVRFYIIKNNIPYPAIWVFTLGRLDPFALGAFLSYLYLNPKFKPRPLIALVLSLFLFKLVICSTGIGMPNTIWQLFVVDLAGCLLIYSALYSRKMSQLLSMKPLPWLGKVSFGLYIFHDIMIHLTADNLIASLTKHIPWLLNSLTLWFVSLALTLLATILCAGFSYHAFEKHFLKLKTRFTIIASRPA